MRHATDPDHVVAVTTIVSRERSTGSAALIGGFWGIGHALTVFAVGAGIILFGIVIPARLGLSLGALRRNFADRFIVAQTAYDDAPIVNANGLTMSPRKLGQAGPTEFAGDGFDICEVLGRARPACPEFNWRFVGNPSPTATSSSSPRLDANPIIHG